MRASLTMGHWMGFAGVTLLGTFLGMLGGCASGPMLRAGGQGASVTVDVRNDRSARPGTLRLAAADYTIDGLSVLSLRPSGAAVEDVPDAASWTGALNPGEHVLEARLQYPPRAAVAGDDMAFEVLEKYRFRSGRDGAVRIRVEEEAKGSGLTASVDQRLGVKISEY